MNKYIRSIELIKAGEDAKQTVIANIQAAALKKHTRRKIVKSILLAICAAFAVGISIFFSIVLRPAASAPPDDESYKNAQIFALDGLQNM